jgi:hypothetical protein
MVTTIHQLNTGCFIFLGFLSENEMLHLGGTLYTLVIAHIADVSPGQYRTPCQNNFCLDIASLGAFLCKSMLISYWCDFQNKARSSLVNSGSWTNLENPNADSGLRRDYDRPMQNVCHGKRNGDVYP